MIPKISVMLTMFLQQYGSIELINRTNKYKIALNFKPAGWFGYDLNRFDGFILNERGQKLRFLYGKWNDYMKTAAVQDYERYLQENNHKFRPPDKPLEGNTNNNGAGAKVLLKINSLKKQLTGVGVVSSSFDSTNVGDITEETSSNETSNCEIPKSDSTHSLDISNSRIIWKVLPRPANSAEYYHFNSFTFALNELPRDTDRLEKLPKTDSRFRPDIRKLEEGDLGLC